MNDLGTQEVMGLLGRVSAGDQRAVASIYRHYHRQLFGFVSRLVKDQQAAEEIVQDTFMGVCRNASSFDGSCKFSTWMCQIAHRRVVDWWRRHGRTPVTESLQDEAERIPDLDSLTALEHLEAEELKRLLMTCVDRLPLPQAEAVVLVYWDGQSLDEVARIQNCPVNTVKTRLFHSRLKMKECVELSMRGGHHHD